jgi:hypothetical protein
MPRDSGQQADPSLHNGDNTVARYEHIKGKFERLKEIKAEQKALAEEAGKIVNDLEKESGVNRGALAEIRRLDNLDAAAIAKREKSREELYALLVKPRLDEAGAGQSDE